MGLFLLSQSSQLGVVVIKKVLDDVWCFCYNLCMESGVFITDNRLSFSQVLAGELRDKGLKVCLSSDVKEDGEYSSTEIEWNRASLFSLQSLMVQLKNIKLVADTSIIVFDAADYVKLYPSLDATAIDKNIGDLISANLALSLMLKNYYIKKAQGRLLFVYRGLETPCGNPCISAAASAFVRIAEETVDAIRKAELPGIQTLLVKLEGYDDENFAKWISNQLDLTVLSKSTGRWVKAGQRGFFGK